jgi:hypothetical protein
MKQNKPNRNFVGKTCCLAAVIVGFCWLALGGHTKAATDLAHTYTARPGSSIVQGTLVSIKKDDSHTVEPSNDKLAENLVGVVVDVPLVSLGTETASSLQVATDGTTNALVSDINGAVQVGDKITPSPIAGVGMKATADCNILGTVQANMSDVHSSSRIIADAEGKQRVVYIASLPVQINVSHYSAPKKRSFVPGFIQDFANKIAGHDVSPIRALIATGIALLVFISNIVVLYAAIKSSIISIGRNPLAAASVRRSMTHILIISVVIILLGLSTVYLILTT